MNRQPLDLTKLKPLYFKCVKTILKDNYRTLTPEIYDHVLLFDTEVLFPSALQTTSNNFKKFKIKTLTTNVYSNISRIQFENYQFDKWFKEGRDFRKEDYKEIYITRGLCNLLAHFADHFKGYECVDQTFIEITEDHIGKLPQSVYEKVLVKISARDLMPDNTYDKVKTIWDQL